MKISVRKLAVSALFITADVLLTRILAINTPLMKIGFGFAAVALSALISGPLWAMLTAALGDLLGALLFPVGAYFPGFTLTAALTGLIFGLVLYKKTPGALRALAAAGINCVLVTLLGNTAMIAYISGTEFMPLLVTRLVQWAVLYALGANGALRRLIERERE